jgi:carbamoyl-phosphate synthase small subunit
MMMNPATLVLASGEEFKGHAPVWQHGVFFGEIVFNTGMTGYVETLTDPSYAGQILTFTFPLIGNYGVGNAVDWESKKIHVRGVVLQTAYNDPKHYAVEKNLLTWLEEQKIPVLTAVDTRALTKAIREHGTVLGALVCQRETPKKFEDIDAQHWVKQVTLDQPITLGSGTKKIIAVDCGMKENIMRELLKFPIRIKRVPFDYDYSNEDYDGIFLSNGPGDPKLCETTVAILKQAMKKNKPIFGICLGTQLMALAIDADTYKLNYGHRGQNQPCQEIKTQRAFLTSQNHGYAIDEKTLPKDWHVSFINLNDGTVAGIQHNSKPWFSVQFHPEAAAGPHDTHFLFNDFYKLL